MTPEAAPHRQLWFYRVALAMLVLCVLCIGYTVFLLVRPYKTVSLESPISITNAPIQAGSVAIYSVDQCRYTGAVVHTIRRLVSDDTLTFTSDLSTYSSTSRNIYIPLGSSDSRAPVGCHKFFPPPVVIPSDTPAGKYHIEFELHFDVNPIREVVKTYESKPFLVIKSQPVK